MPERELYFLVCKSIGCCYTIIKVLLWATASGCILSSYKEMKAGLGLYFCVAETSGCDSIL